jgi:hypothetical protein
MCRDPNNNIKAVGNYLRADEQFEGENDYFDPNPQLLRKIWTIAVHKTILMLIVCLHLEIMSSNQRDGT